MVEETKEETHPLQNEWVLWEHKAVENKNPNHWKENMMALCSFNTVEEFWRYINHIPRPSEVFFDGEYRKKVDGKTVEEYSLFKKGIEPEWGDPRNVTGGEWFFRQSLDGTILDLYWQNLVLAAIGETMEVSTASSSSESPSAPALQDAINGVRVLDKSRGYPVFKLEIWLSTRDPAIRDAIKERIQDVMSEGHPAGASTTQRQPGGRNAHSSHPKFEWKDHSA